MSDDLLKLNFIVEGKPLYYELAEYMIQNMGLKTKGHYTYIYDKTHYKMIDDFVLQKKVINLMSKKCQPYWFPSHDPRG